MRYNKLLFLFFLIWTAQVPDAHAGSTAISVPWQFNYNDQWYPAQTPFSIHTDLLSNKLIGDPFYADNETQQQWIGQRDWEYKTTFDVSDTTLSKKHLELVFTSLDTYVDVYLNDSLILNAENMFREWRVECKGLLKKNGNALRLIFHSAEKKAKELYEKYPYKLPGEERVMTRKAQFQFGWDWAPRFITCGLQNMQLEAWDDFRVAFVRMKQNYLDQSQAQLMAVVEVEAATSTPVTIVVRDKKTKRKLTESEADVIPGTNMIRVRYSLDQVYTWWCNGIGKATMYEFIFEVKGNNNQSETKEVRTGLRTLSLVNDLDSSGTSFYFELNGSPVFMKGANYVPQDVFPNRVTDENYRTLLKAVKDAGMNMIRVWGGGAYQRDEFYDLCDEYGILVWHDFMFAGGMYPFDSAYLNNVRKEAQYQVKRLSNHPCMALWCGNNECSEGWNRWGWQDGLDSAQKAEIWFGYQKIFNDILPNAVVGFSQIAYWESSPEFGRGDARHTHEGDAHNWFVWHDGEPFENYEQKVPRFMSEFGFQSMPGLKSLRMFLPDSALSLTSAAMKVHQKHSRGFAIINAYMQKQYGTVPVNFSDYVKRSQQLQAEAMTRGVTAHLDAKPYCMGSLVWQLNDCWPSVSWSMIDYYGNKKPVYESVKKLFLGE